MRDRRSVIREYIQWASAQTALRRRPQCAYDWSINCDEYSCRADSSTTLIQRKLAGLRWTPLRSSSFLRRRFD